MAIVKKLVCMGFGLWKLLVSIILRYHCWLIVNSDCKKTVLHGLWLWKLPVLGSVDGNAYW